MWEAQCALQEDEDEDELLESKEASAQSDEEEIDLTLTMGKLISLISVTFCALISPQYLQQFFAAAMISSKVCSSIYQSFNFNDISCSKTFPSKYIDFWILSIYLAQKPFQANISLF